ncbi:hypothetical protein Plhal703r1_c04g0021131 [Plasmopara halstedii]
MNSKHMVVACLSCCVVLSLYALVAHYETTTEVFDGVGTQVHRHLVTNSLMNVTNERGHSEERTNSLELTTVSETAASSLGQLQLLMKKICNLCEPIARFIKRPILKLYLRFASNKRKAVGTLFKKVQVDKVTKNLFESKQYREWSHIVCTVLKKDLVGARDAMYSVLEGHYTDVQLVKFFDEVQSTTQNENLAEAFKIFEVYLQYRSMTGADGLTTNLLSNRLFRMWLVKVYWLEMKDSWDIMLLSELTLLLTKDSMIEMRINALLDVQASSALMKEEDLEKWTLLQSTVIELLKYIPKYHHNDFLTALMNQYFDSTVWFMRTGNTDLYSRIFSWLSSRLYDIDLAQLLVNLEKNDDMKEVVSAFENELIWRWVGESKTASDIFSRLEIFPDIAENPLLSIWVSFVVFEAKMNENVNAREVIYDVLKNYKIDDPDSVIDLIVDKVVPRVRKALLKTKGFSNTKSPTNKQI